MKVGGEGVGEKGRQPQVENDVTQFSSGCGSCRELSVLL